MPSHPNARLTQKGRLRPINQHLLHHRPLAELAAEAGISLRCAYKWLARYRSGGVAALMNRHSVRSSQRRTLDPHRLQCAVELRHQRLHLRHIARLLSAPFSTVARALNRLGLGRLRNLEPLRLRFCEAVATRAARRAPEARRPDPHRRQKAGPLPPGRTSHHRQPAAGTLHGHRLPISSAAAPPAARLTNVVRHNS